MNTQQATAMHAGIEPPHGTAGDWQHHAGITFRLLYRTARTVPERPHIVVQSTAVQLGDGSIDTDSVIEPPGVHVEVGGGHPLTVEQARRLAVEVLAAADFLARLAPDPAHPLDAYSLPATVDHLTRRINGPGALRHALASTDPPT